VGDGCHADQWRRVRRVIVALVVFLAVVLAVGVVLVLRAVLRPDPDGVDVFRRQIDALSPEARRPVVDRVQELDDRDDPEPDDDAGRK